MIEQDPDDGPLYPRWTVIGYIPTPHHSFSLSVHQLKHATDRRSHDGPSCMTVMVVRDLCPKGLHFFPSFLLWTSMTKLHTLDVPSCTTVITVRDPSPKGLHTFSKCPVMDIDDGPSLSQRSVLLIRHNCLRLSFRGIHIHIVEVRHEKPHDGPSYSRGAVT